MRFLAAALLIALFACNPAHAEQNFFLKKTLTRNVQDPAKPEDANKSSLTPNPATDQGVQGTQAPASTGRTPITNDQANSYYDNCLQQKSASFTQSGQQMLCACTAAQMQKEMTVEDVQNMAQNNPQGQAIRDKMTLFVYAPCMKYPTHDLIYTRCMSDPQLKTAVKNQDALCKCMGDGMADFIEEKGPEALVTSMRQNPGDLDPLGSLMNSDAFNQQAQKTMQTCAPKGMQ